MNVISFSLYGDNPRYLQGALRNVELARKYYPGWECWFWVPNSKEWSEVFREITVNLVSEGAKKFEASFSWKTIPPMFWRFLAAGTQVTERLIVRDCDSRIGQREADAVQAWIGSDKILHIMRDHPAHQLVPGGMFGLQPQRDNWEMPSRVGCIAMANQEN
jgi:hypothetical protein